MMMMGGKHIVMFIIFSFALFSLAKADFEIEDLYENPYRELSIAPWSSMKEVKQKYKELVKKYHPDKSQKKSHKEKFIDIQKAYEKIKSLRSVDEDEDDEVNERFWDAVKDSSAYVIVLFIVLFMNHIAITICNKIYSVIWKPIFYVCATAIIVSKMFPHYFKSLEKQIIFSMVFGLFLNWFKRILASLRKFLTSKTKDEEVNKKKKNEEVNKKKKN
jgi:curved DNA-binding protein CbpA